VKKSENYFVEMKQAYDEYFDILINGCNDPFWEDGANINLCANHFHYYKEQIKEEYPKKNWACLDWIYETLLVKVPYEYMARQDEIRAGARNALAAFESDKNLLFIREHIGLLSKKEIDSMCADNIFGYSDRLKSAIEEDNLVVMRRYESYEKYLESFRECAAKMKNVDFGLFGI
jgi:hypothetical protein